ncbi:L,D-transpeptidase [Streptomyces sp. NPDC021096]|uniref:L,D-transpeptidase n=1 Tax=Streptomyces sp. NPDC021096 TaxID=3154792 RepID=UPI0033C18E33
MPRTSSFRVSPALTGGAVATALAATALLAPAGEAAPAAAADYLQFTKDTPAHSRLTVFRDHRPVAEYRAGSGTSEQECERGRGWLPDGTYTLGRHHTAYNGNLVKGYAIELGDKRCHDGTLRTELFIHSEMTRDGGSGGPENQRWDGESDYTSHGCVKLRPQDIKELYRSLDRDGWPATLKVVHG